MVEETAPEFYRSSTALSSTSRFDIDKFKSVWSSLITSGMGVIFGIWSSGKLVGAIGGMCHPDIYGSDLVAEEFFWFVSESYRKDGIRLYRTFENWARERGAKTLQMVHLSDSMPDKLKKFYLRSGFAEIETRYAKSL